MTAPPAIPTPGSAPHVTWTGTNTLGEPPESMTGDSARTAALQPLRSRRILVARSRPVEDPEHQRSSGVPRVADRSCGSLTIGLHSDLSRSTLSVEPDVVEVVTARRSTGHPRSCRYVRYLHSRFAVRTPTGPRRRPRSGLRVRGSYAALCRGSRGSRPRALPARLGPYGSWNQDASLIRRTSTDVRRADARRCTVRAEGRVRWPGYSGSSSR